MLHGVPPHNPLRPMTTLASNDRLRAARRLPTDVTASIRLPEDTAWVEFQSRNISAVGLFVESQLLFDVGTCCALEVPLPDGSRFRGHARVARLAWGDASTPGMGLEFLHLNDLDRRRLARVLGL